MNCAISLFPKTIFAMNNKLMKLRKKFKIAGGEDVTGASSRLLDPDRVSMFENICMLENLITRVRPLSRPDQNSCAQVGHEVTIACDDNQKLQFNLCSGLDVKYFVKKHHLSGRLLSDDSSLGILLLGKSVGDEIRYGNNDFRITGIKVSKYL